MAAMAAKAVLDFDIMVFAPQVAITLVAVSLAKRKPQVMPIPQVACQPPRWQACALGAKPLSAAEDGQSHISEFPDCCENASNNDPTTRLAYRIVIVWQ